MSEKKFRFNLMTLLPFELLSVMTGIRQVFLYYHMISDVRDIPHLRNLYRYKSIKQFNKDLDYLQRHFRTSSIKEVLGEKNPGEKTFVLTFDDGFREMYEIVAPLLESRGINAVFFINNNFIDNKSMNYKHKASLLTDSIHKGGLFERTEVWHVLSPGSAVGTDVELIKGIMSVPYRKRDKLDRMAEIMDVDFKAYLREQKPYMTTLQIESLRSRGFEIGAHSLDHPDYSELDQKEQEHQTFNSMEGIAQLFDLKDKYFAFPNSDRGASGSLMAQLKAGDKVDWSFGTGGISRSLSHNHIQRVSLEKPLMSSDKIIKYHMIRSNYRKF